MGQKLGGMDHGYALLSGVSWVAVEHKVPWTEAYLRIIWHLSRLATTDMGRKWGLCPFREGGAGSPSNTLSPRLKPTSVPSGILMHTAVWPQ